MCQTADVKPIFRGERKELAQGISNVQCPIQYKTILAVETAWHIFTAKTITPWTHGIIFEMFIVLRPIRFEGVTANKPQQ